MAGDFHTKVHTSLKKDCKIKEFLKKRLGSSPVSRTNGKSLALQGFFFAYKKFLTVLSFENDMQISKIDAKISPFFRVFHTKVHTAMASG
jgi:hypothetical protein